MAATTVMGVVMAHLVRRDAGRPAGSRHLPTAGARPLEEGRRRGKAEDQRGDGQQQDPLGWLGGTSVGETLHDPSKVHWLSLVGVLGILIAFGHSVLAMSGEETLAQVYREVESPKLANFKKAAFIVFIYSLLLTSLISFFAVMIIPTMPG